MFCLGKHNNCNGAYLCVRMLNRCMQLFSTSSDSFFVDSVLHVASAVFFVTLLSFGILSLEPRIDVFERFCAQSFLFFVAPRFVHLLPVRGYQQI